MMTIAITGASGYIGQRLVALLAAEPGVDRILALDVRPLQPLSPKVISIHHDVTQSMEGLFVEHCVQVAAHLAFVLNPTHDRTRERAVNVGGTENFLRACHTAGVKALLITSSATAYGALPDNLPLIPEDAPLRGKAGYPYVEDKLAQEQLAARYAAEHPTCRVLVTRATVVAGPHIDNFLSRFFQKRLSFAVRGADPAIPLVHEDDTAEATHRILLEAPAGAYNINAVNPVPLSEITKAMGARVLHLPPAGLYPLAGLAWRLRLRAVSEVPPAMLDYIRYPWVADGSKVTRLTGFQYRYDGRATFEDFLRGRIGQASQEQDRAAGPITD